MAGIAAVIVAAGRGLRAGADMPKQFRPILGAPMLRQSLVMLLEHPEVGFVQPVIHRDDVEIYSILGRRIAAAGAGVWRRDAAGVRARRARSAHRARTRDRAGARRGAALRQRALSPRAPSTRREQSGAAIPALPVTDTVKSVDAANHVTGTIDRAKLRLVQTPQAFAFPALARRASQGRSQPARRFHRRCRLGRMGRADGDRVCRRGRQHQDHHARRFCPRASCLLRRARRRAHRLRHRRPCLRPRRSCHARRRAHCAHPRADRSLRRRRRAARADRRHARRARRRRHRRAFSAQRSAMEAAPPPTAFSHSRSSASPRAAAASPISTSTSSARRRASARIATPCAQISRGSPASASIAWR